MGKKISEMPLVPVPADGDMFPGLDVSAAPAARNGRFALSALATYVLAKLPAMTNEEAIAGVSTAKRGISAATLSAALAAAASGVQHQWAGLRAPLATDDGTDGYAPGSLWSWGNKVWLCVDATTNLAGWVDLTAGGAPWRGPWASGTSYAAGDMVSRDEALYAASAAHVAGASTAPGTGASWATVWELMLESGGGGGGGSGLPGGGSNGQLLGRVSGSPAWVDPPESGAGCSGGGRS